MPDTHILLMSLATQLFGYSKYELKYSLILQLARHAEEIELTVNDFMSKAKPYIERLHEVWMWQNQNDTAYRKEHRPSSVVRRHKCYR